MRIFFMVFPVAAILSASIAFAGSGSCFLYRGEMRIAAFSGKGCSGNEGSHPVPVEMVIERSEEGGTVRISGYYKGEEIMIGKFSGSGSALLPVSYTDEKDEGHFLSITGSGETITAELTEKHSDESDDCIFDRASLKLQRVAEGGAAVQTMHRVSLLYSAQLLRREGNSLYRVENYAAAVSSFEKALSLVEEAEGKESPGLSEYLEGLGQAFTKVGRFEDARLALERGLKVADNDHERSEMRETIAWMWGCRGLTADSRREYADAVKYYRTALTYAPTSAVIAVNLANALCYGGECAEAERVLDTAAGGAAAKEDRDLIAAVRSYQLYYRGSMAEQHEEFGEAVKLYSEALKRNPEEVDIVAALGGVYVRQGKFDEAQELLERTAASSGMENVRKALSNSLADLFAARGRESEKRSDLPAAQKWFRKALEKNPGEYTFVTSLARALRKTGSFPEAIELLKTASLRFKEETALREISEEMEKGRIAEMLARGLKAAK